MVSGTQTKVNTAVKKQSAEKKKNVPFAPTSEAIIYGKTNVRMKLKNHCKEAAKAPVIGLSRAGKISAATIHGRPFPPKLQKIP